MKLVQFRKLNDILRLYTTHNDRLLKYLHSRHIFQDVHQVNLITSLRVDTQVPIFKFQNQMISVLSKGKPAEARNI